MPLSHQLRERTIWITSEGSVEYQDGMDTLEAAIASARAADAGAHWDMAFDLRLSGENRSSEELRGIAQFVADNIPPLSGRCVLIAHSDLLYGLSRMFQAHCELLEIDSAVVRDVATAEAWIAGTTI